MRNWLVRVLGVVGLMLAGASPVLAEDPPAIVIAEPVNVAGYITAALTTFGSVLAAVIAAYFAILIVRKAMTWARRAFA